MGINAYFIITSIINTVQVDLIQTNTRRSTNAGLMLDHRLRR